MMTSQSHVAPTPTPWDSFQLGPFNPPRLWVGLWQLSSTAWGSAPASRIREAMARHVDQGYTAFGKRVLSQLWRTVPLILPSPLVTLSDMVNLSFVQNERPLPERSDGYHFTHSIHPTSTSLGPNRNCAAARVRFLRSVPPLFLSHKFYPF